MVDVITRIGQVEALATLTGNETVRINASRLRSAADSYKQRGFVDLLSGTGQKMSAELALRVNEICGRTLSDETLIRELHPWIISQPPINSDWSKMINSFNWDERKVVNTALAPIVNQDHFRQYLHSIDRGEEWPDTKLGEIRGYSLEELKLYIPRVGNIIAIFLTICFQKSAENNQPIQLRLLD